MMLLPSLKYVKLEHNIVLLLFGMGMEGGEQGLAPHLDDSIVRDPSILVALVLESL